MEFAINTAFSDDLKDEWNALLRRSVTNVPFLRYEYLRAWWQTRGGGEWSETELALVTARRDGQLVGAAALIYTAEHENVPSLLFAGSIEVSDYLDVLAAPEDLQCFMDELLPFLAEADLPQWDRIDLYNVLDSSPALSVLEAAAQKQGWTYQVEEYQPSPYIVLPGDWDSHLAGIDKKQRHEIRRKIRRLESDETPSRWYVVDNPDTLEVEIEDFLRLMEQEHNKSEFLTENMKEHMRLTIRCSFDMGILALYFLEIDGKKAAAKLCFDDQGRLWAYNSGINRDFDWYSPGWVLLGYILQWANEQGYQEFDFMRGDEKYKYRFGAVDRFVMRATVKRK